MYYKYNCGNKIIVVYVNEYQDYVTVTDSKKCRSYDRSVRKDENGKFFTWNKNKVYLENWIRTSVKEIKEKLDRKEHVTDDDLCQAILSDGVDKVRFIVPINLNLFYGFCADTKTKDVLCKIEESYNRTVKSNYKIRFVPVNPDDSLIDYRDFYTMDLVSLIKDGYIKIVL